MGYGNVYGGACRFYTSVLIIIIGHFYCTFQYHYNIVRHRMNCNEIINNKYTDARVKWSFCPSDMAYTFVQVSCTLISHLTSQLIKRREDR